MEPHFLDETTRQAMGHGSSAFVIVKIQFGPKVCTACIFWIEICLIVSNLHDAWLNKNVKNT